MVFPLKTRNSAQDHPKNAQDKVFLFLQNIYLWVILNLMQYIQALDNYSHELSITNLLTK